MKTATDFLDESASARDLKVAQPCSRADATSSRWGRGGACPSLVGPLKYAKRQRLWLLMPLVWKRTGPLCMVPLAAASFCQIRREPELSTQIDGRPGGCAGQTPSDGARSTAIAVH